MAADEAGAPPDGVRSGGPASERRPAPT
jgi:hypothetical protein